MLVRTYRLTDKVGIVLLKCGVGAGNLALDSLNVLVGAGARGGGGVLGLLLAIVLGFANLIWRILQTLWGVIKRFASLIFGVGSSVAFIGGRVTNRATRGATRSTVSAANNTMARRAARAELEETIIEDPLRSQNRLLSALFVVVLAVLVGVVLWATGSIGDSNNNPNPPLDANVFNNDNLLPVATSSGLGGDIPTPVPTAQPVAEVLRAGGSLAFVARERGQDDIWVANVGSQAPLRLTNDPADDRDPAWSPDSTQLAYASRREGNWDIYIQDMNAVGTTEPRRMTFGLGFQAGPEWSPDGQYIAYESYQGNNLDIYIMPADGSEAGQPLPISTEFPEYSPAWSPNLGRRIAYVSMQDGNQEIYVLDFNASTTSNITNTPTIHEDYPAWSPDGRYLAYSAVENGIEVVFIKDLENLSAPAQAFRQGRMPYWSPDGNSIIYGVNTFDGGTQFLVAPFTATSVVSDITSIGLSARNAVWTSAPLPASFVNSGGLEVGVTEPLFIEQVEPPQGDPPYGLGTLFNVEAPNPALSERVNDSFNALRAYVLQSTGVDFLGELEHALWGLDYRPQAGEDNPNWHMTGRAFSFNRNLILSFPAPVEIVREDTDLRTYWRVYIRVDDDAQQGELGEPLRRFPWSFPNPNQGDVATFDAGGRLRSTVPTGYYVDLTQIIEDFEWERMPAGTNWRANVLARNYWIFRKSDGLTIYDALRELYAESQLGGYVPTATPPPIATLESENDDDGAG